jgi:hypothetical protein
MADFSERRLNHSENNRVYREKCRNHLFLFLIGQFSNLLVLLIIFQIRCHVQFQFLFRRAMQSKNN